MRSSQSSIQKGFTLLEVMVVLLILSMLLGYGIGAFSKVGGGASLASAWIKDVVRQARFHAKREQAPSCVRLDPEQNLVVGFGWKRVGSWHFEDAQDGFSSGFPESLVLTEAQLHPHGIIGRSLDLSATEQGGLPEVYAPTSASLDSLNGVAMECFVFLKNPGRCALLSKGEAYSFGLNEEGRMIAHLRLAKEGSSLKDTGKEYTLDTPAYWVPEKKWVKLGFHFNGYSFSISAEGIMRNRQDFSHRMRFIPHERKPLLIGTGSSTFEGFLDELHLAAVIVGEEVPFHESIRLDGPSRTIHFDPRGRLDRDFHTRPVAVEYLHNESRRYRVLIDLSGEVR